MADPNKPNSKVLPVDFKNAAKQACETTFEDAESIYPLRGGGRLPYVCMDLTYQYTLLVEGFGRFAMTLGICDSCVRVNN